MEDTLTELFRFNILSHRVTANNKIWLSREGRGKESKSNLGWMDAVHKIQRGYKSVHKGGNERVIA